MSALLVSESQVRAVQAPEGTSTWNPFPHALLLDELEFARELSGLRITSTRYELSKSGRQFFGVWTFGQVGSYRQAGDYRPQLSVGFRNSIDKSISIGITAGTYVIVCSNMAFSGEWMHFRKHTKNVLEDLKYFSIKAFGIALERSRKETIWQANLDTLPISHEEWKCLTYDAVDQLIIPPTKVVEFLDTKLERSVGSWFNVATSILSQRSLLNTEHQYTKLRQLVSPFAEAA